MARTPNQEHVRRTLEALAILRTEPGWHRVAVLADAVGARPERLAADLRRACYAAQDWHLPLVFGDDLEPPHPAGAAAVQLAADVPITLPLPASRAELTRLALLADTAARVDPDDQRTPVLRAFHDRVSAALGLGSALDVRLTAPDAVGALREAVDRRRAVRFAYRALDAPGVTERTVSPQRVWRDERWWLLLGYDHGRAAARTFRVDRIAGAVADAGPARPDTGTGGAQPGERAAVRLRIGADEQWVVDGHDPTGLVEDGSWVEVTIRLYPPVDARLSRLLFLLRPGAAVVSTELPGGVEAALAAHRRALDALQRVDGYAANARSS